MKRVLITGAGSYLGENIAAALMKEPEDFLVETLDMQQATWKNVSFSGFDAVIHVAGIAHQRETKENAEYYYRINRDLAYDTAEKAKAEGIGQFVFFSSMSVYGITSGRITAGTPENPKTHYGKSKLLAEEAIARLSDGSFRVAILRPPMIYGRGCRGNYPRLSRMVQKLPLFPQVKNERSMLYIGGLCTFVAQLVQSGRGGLFFPQNCEYVSTDELARQIALARGKKLWQPKGAGWLIRLLAKRVGTLGKVFGTLTYDREMSQDFADPAEVPFAETIRLTEGGA